ncbi:hypothetical protein [Microbacterium esteraromaticum]|uniref:hypothetical protein n=1 Tax=Microbacterium esteraromaticum TaxID=57043 RepID=UPI0019D32CC8|nr:hypothetical protein [Microbacterium esteraromaticum]MBN7792411.1 hypothetical protein [Microbacterium esteraromaticum]
MTTDQERGAEFDRLYRVMHEATEPGGPGGVSLTTFVRHLFDEGVRVTPLLPVVRELYVVCNTLLDSEENRHCEFDGDITFTDGRARCPGCRRVLNEVEGVER